MKKAVIYARYSSDSQTEQSIEGQLRVCKDYAKNKDIIIVDTYIDRAMTGTNDKRPGFQKMIADSTKKEWDYVLVYKLDRFSRNKYETAIHKKTLIDNGVRVISATEYLPDTPEAIIYETMLEGFAEYYSKELSQKINRGLRESRLKGQFCGGGIPYGYKVIDKKLIIDENEAKTIIFIFAQYIAGISVPEICKLLTEKGILYKEKIFTESHLYKILSNKKYTGIYILKGEIYPNIYPQIVSNDTYNKVNLLLRHRRYNNSDAKVIYALKDKLVCGYCGNKLTSESGTAKNGKVARYYKCKGRKRLHNNCGLNTFNKDYLEKIVSDEIINAICTDEKIDKIVNSLNELQTKRFVENENLRLLKNAKQKVDLALQNIVSAIERGVVSNTTNKRLQELENEQEMLSDKIIQEEHNSQAMIPLEDLKTYFKKALSLEPLMLINYFVKTVKIFNDKIEILCNTPLQNDPDENLGLILYKKAKFLTFHRKKTGKSIKEKVQIIMIF